MLRMRHETVEYRFNEFSQADYVSVARAWVWVCVGDTKTTQSMSIKPSKVRTREKSTRVDDMPRMRYYRKCERGRNDSRPGGRRRVFAVI